MKSILMLLSILAAGPLWAQANRDNAVIQFNQGSVPGSDGLQQSIIGLEAYREVMETGKYLIGPGDVFLVYVSGMTGPYISEVLAEGGLFVPKVGAIAIGGLRLAAARKKVIARFREIVKVGEIDFELSRPRRFPVPVVGSVTNPGVKSATGVERISQILAKAGGLNASASSRNIRLIKTSQLDPGQKLEIERQIAAGYLGDLQDLSVARADLELYGVTGESHYNPFVEDGDIILVLPQIGQMGALGAVQRPDFYEFVPGDRLSDLLLLSLGPAPNYDATNVLLFRYEQDNITRKSHRVEIVAALAGEADANILLHPDDWLNVRAIPGFHADSQVRVVGEVQYPGYYVVGQKGVRLRVIIEQAGGFTENASLAEGRVVRQKFVSGEQGVDPEFERLRYVPVPDRTELDDQYFIMKSREKPGQLSIDLVELFKKGNEEHNILLLPGDVIAVPTLQQTVTVSGAVVRPGAVNFKEVYTVWDYIDRSGGLGWRASRDVLVIKALSGEKKRAKNVSQIQPGDRIWVREEPERDYWTIFTQSMGVVGQVATVVLLFVSITK
ncbi:MAG TPA: hypothetical protein EYG11_17220 [Candidatus Latescibacteria bacterium]|nr:hypothetical protein [Candidatus Latescibacterota bacterium]